MPSADHAASLPATFPVRLGALGVRESPSPLSPAGIARMSLMCDNDGTRVGWVRTEDIPG